MMQHNQVFVIQVSGGGHKPHQLALPAPPGALLPSEVKYSASLVRCLGFTHLVLAAVLFILGVIGSWVEPETCWSGAGVWGSLTTALCGICGLLAHKLWYKNFTIKAFLVSSVASVIINTLAFILTIYSIVNRHKHFATLLEQLEQYPWFQPYDADREHQLSLSVSANLVVGFLLEVAVALWSVKVGWRGVRAPDFTASQHHQQNDDLEEHSITSLPHHGQQVPLAALYQLLQTHPELLGPKNVVGGVGSPWEDHPSHRSMDYQERVNRFLSHNAIQDQSQSFPRSLSTVVSEGSSSGGRGSPAETLPIMPDHTRAQRQAPEPVTVHHSTPNDKVQHPVPDPVITHHNTSNDRVQRQTPETVITYFNTASDMVQHQAPEPIITHFNTSSDKGHRPVPDQATAHPNAPNDKIQCQAPEPVITHNNASSDKVQRQAPEPLITNLNTSNDRVQRQAPNPSSVHHNTSSGKIQRQAPEPGTTHHNALSDKNQRQAPDPIAVHHKTPSDKIQHQNPEPVATLQNAPSEKTLRKAPEPDTPHQNASSSKIQRQAPDPVTAQHNAPSDKKQRLSNSELLKLKRSEQKPKAPAPKVNDKINTAGNKNSSDIKIMESETVVKNNNHGECQKVDTNSENKIREVQDKQINNNDNQLLATNKTQDPSVTKENTPEQRPKDEKKAQPTSSENVKREGDGDTQVSEVLNTKDKDKHNESSTSINIDKSNSTAETKESLKETKVQEDTKDTKEQHISTKDNNTEVTENNDQLVLLTDIKPPCEFQDS